MACELKGVWRGLQEIPHTCEEGRAKHSPQNKSGPTIGKREATEAINAQGGVCIIVEEFQACIEAVYVFADEASANAWARGWFEEHYTLADYEEWAKGAAGHFEGFEGQDNVLHVYDRPIHTEAGA